MSKICPMCGAFMKTNVCEYCRYEIEVPEEEVKKEPEYQEKQVFVQPNTIVSNQPIYGQNQYDYKVDAVSEKNKIVAFVLCFFLGYMGVHHFYVGKIGYGIVYFFTMGIFGFGWLIDLVLIALGQFKDKYGLPLK